MTDNAYTRRFLKDSPEPEPEILVDLGKGDDRTEETSVDDVEKEEG